ncbi:carbohydrate ABC transporter permease [Halorubrum lipolyticum]|uniref:Binding-protein-dependent transport systems inner membrane component n=1 Tax=Halorubrum lipolyticum DSM 21995 TaxID=1227482 RepID=M0NP98_9EURY|nr:sugar ABC transporter permease [Halorubrum lipolyticum]EMA59586.1 binding-protein-dependent transport systems inner membrane component [Halorubrum lipolyticum DSM 21995]
MATKDTGSILSRLPGVDALDSETRDGVLFALPYLLVFGVFLLYPLLKGLYMSLFDWNAFNPSQSEFVLAENYVRMVQDPTFWAAVRATALFVILTVPTLVGLGLVLALGVSQDIKGKRFLRTVFFSPYVLTVSVVSLIWAEMYAPQYGPINYYLGLVMSNPPAWLNSFTFAMPAVALATIWWTVGFNFVILLAARQGVSERLYEAARIDGASTWRAFKDITLPQMRSAIVFVTTVQLIASFQVFGQVFIMTNGGPNDTTQTLVMYLYRVAFRQQEFGYAAAIGYFLFVVLVAVSLVNYKFVGGDD